MPTMVASDLYSGALQALVDTRNMMITDAWFQQVQALPTVALRQEAQLKPFRVEHAIQILSNAILSDIAGQLAAQSDDIVAATQELDDSLEDVTKVTQILDNITNLLTVVGKVVSLA